MPSNFQPQPDSTSNQAEHPTLSAPENPKIEGPLPDYPFPDEAIMRRGTLNEVGGGEVLKWTEQEEDGGGDKVMRDWGGFGGKEKGESESRGNHHLQQKGYGDLQVDEEDAFDLDL